MPLQVQREQTEEVESAIETLGKAIKEAEGRQKGNLSLIAGNLEDQMDFFCYGASVSVINDNQKEALKGTDSLYEDTDADNIVDERDEIAEEIRKEAGIDEDDENWSVRVALPVAHSNGFEELAEKLEAVNEKMDEVREDYKELKKEPSSEKNDAKSRMAAKIETIHGRNIESPDGVKTDVDE
jgi:hypothetical protein